MTPLSITANLAKLMKHMDSLQRLQERQPSPVLLCIALTNRCQLECPHCMFRDRDRGLELDPEVLLEATAAFAKLGIKSIELTGGGEPTLYPYLEDYLDWLDTKGFDLPIGINTNAFRIGDIHWERFAWVRFNLNVLDQCPPAAHKNWTVGLREIGARNPAVSGCYIVRDDTNQRQFQRAVDFAWKEQLPTRMAPDCQNPPGIIRRILGKSSARLAAWVTAHPRRERYAFVSDFNTPFGGTCGTGCYLHLLKPLLWPDGHLYVCPSAALALENGTDVAARFRVCRAEEIAAVYDQPEILQSRSHDCSFCKYRDQNAVLSAVLAETEFNEFV